MNRLLRPVLLAACVLALAAGLTLSAVAVLGAGAGSTGVSAGSAPPPLAGSAGPAGSVAALQQRLTALPRDHRAWARLALAHVEQARASGDARLYAKAEQAVRRATRLAPRDPQTLIAVATLAAARHRFTRALSAAEAALAENPYSAQAHAVRSDALTELGRYRAARRAAERADDLQPGPATFARLSYAAELRGDLGGASRLMRRSRDAAGNSAAAYAFASFHLGELARLSGDHRAAARHYAAALAADPDFLPSLAGRARLAVARGDLVAAERDYRTVVRRLPLLEYVVELAELYQATGRPDLARAQFAVAEASAALARAGGIRTDLETAVYQADHGSPAAALAAARAAYSDRRTVHTSDALGWALHANGQDVAALPHLRQANRLGTRDPVLLFHLGMVEAALDRDGAARRHLRAALALDGGSAPLRAQQARAVLAGIGRAR